MSLNRKSKQDIQVDPPSVELIIENDAKNEIEWTEKYLENNYTFLNIDGDDDILKDAVHYVKKYYKPSRVCLLDYLLKRIPFLGWIRNYDIRHDLIKDLVAGLTIGTVHIPSAMAYSLMAGLPPINGLYVTFFIILVYSIFGSSRHLQMGTFSIIALMVNKAVENGKGTLYPDSTLKSNTTTDNSNYLSNDPNEAKVMIAMSVSFLVGIIHVVAGILHLGVTTKFLSDSIINGFTCAATYQILISQINTLLGLKIGKTDLPLALIGNLIEIFKVIQKTNPAAVVISVISILFLYFSRTQINERFKKKLPVPIPFELITVIVATVISYFVAFKERWNVTIVGPMPTGFPPPKVPAFSAISIILSDAISIAIVSYAINISVAKLYAQKNQYEIRPNQELFAYGLGNITVAFFGGFPSCVGLARCIIFESVGGKTQLSGFFSSGLVLLVLLFLGPQFKYLPNAVLASIIVVTLVNKLLEVRIIPKIWKKSKIEALGYIVTFLGVVIFNVDIGLYIGLGFSLILFIIQTQRPRVTILGNIPETDLYEDCKKFKEAKELNGIKIIRYERSVYYANVDNFKYKIIKLSQINPYQLVEKTKREAERKAEREAKKAKKAKKNKETKKNEISVVEINENNIEKETQYLKYIILDCSCMNYIDSQGIKTISQLNKLFKDVGVVLYLSYCKDSIITAFKKFINKDECDLSCIYVSTAEAVRHAQSEMQLKNYESLNIENNSNELPDLTSTRF